MPFESDAQRRFMWAKHPRIAKRWEGLTPKGEKLPEHVKKATAVDRLHSSTLFQKLSGVTPRVGLLKQAANPTTSSTSPSPGPKIESPQTIAANRKTMEMEETRKGDTHQQELQFAQEKHDLEMQKLQLDLEKDKAEFALKMQDLQQKSQEEALQRQQSLQAADAEMGSTLPQPMGDADYKANLAGLSQGKMAGLLRKQSAYEDQYIHGYAQKVPFQGKAKPMAIGTGLGLLAAHLNPTENARKLFDQANKLPKGDAAKWVLRSKGLGANTARLGLGAGGGLLAGLLAHEILD